jgi:serine/threonine-protein kinase
MVTASGQVKLLDFGIAKVLDVTSASAEAATLTRMGWRMLTPEYAAPEQLRGEPASTATDVYALGVLLHELLAGCRPVAGAERAGPPQRPSTQVTESAAVLRSGSSERVRRALRGDLETILLKALHPEPERRYGSAQAFGDDLQRWLDGQPVQARPDSAWYRTRRFVSRHRWGVLAAAVVVLSLASGAFVATWQAREARRQAQEVEKQSQRAEQVKDFLVKILSQSDPETWRDGKEPTVTDVLAAGTRFVDENFGEDRGLHAELLATLGDIHRSRGQYDVGEALIRRSLQERKVLFGEDDPAFADSLYKLSVLEYDRGQWKSALDAATRSAAIFERTLGAHPSTARAYVGMAHAYIMGSRRKEGIELFRKALAINRKFKGESSLDVARTEQTLGHLLVESGDTNEGRAMLQHAVAVNRRLSGPQSMRYASALVTYAQGLVNAGEPERAAEALTEAAGIYRKFNAQGEPGLDTVLTNLADVQMMTGQFSASEANQREALEISRKGPKAGTRWEALRLKKLASTLAVEGRVREAEELHLASIAIMERDAGADHSWLPTSLLAYASFLHFHGRHREAGTHAARALDLFRSQGGAESIGTLGTRGLLARIRFSEGDHKGGLAQADEVLDAFRRRFGPEGSAVDGLVELVSDLQLHSGSPEGASIQFRKLAARYRKGGNRVAAVRNEMLYGASMALLGDTRCERVLRSSLEEASALYGGHGGQAGRARIWLGMCLRAAGDVVAADRLIETGRSEFVRELGDDHEIVRMADDALSAKVPMAR